MDDLLGFGETRTKIHLLWAMLHDTSAIISLARDCYWLTELVVASTEQHVVHVRELSIRNGILYAEKTQNPQNTEELMLGVLAEEQLSFTGPTGSLSSLWNLSTQISALCQRIIVSQNNKIERSNFRFLCWFYVVPPWLRTSGVRLNDVSLSDAIDTHFEKTRMTLCVSYFLSYTKKENYHVVLLCNN